MRTWGTAVAALVVAALAGGCSDSQAPARAPARPQRSPAVQRSAAAALLALDRILELGRTTLADPTKTGFWVRPNPLAGWEQSLREGSAALDELTWECGSEERATVRRAASAIRNCADVVAQQQWGLGDIVCGVGTESAAGTDPGAWEGNIVAWRVAAAREMIDAIELAKPVVRALTR